MKFEFTDFELLLEAIEIWELDPSRDAFVSEMIGTLAGPRPGESREQQTTGIKARLAETELQGRARRERGVVLRAKIIQMRNSLQAEQLTTCRPPAAE